MMTEQTPIPKRLLPLRRYVAGIALTLIAAMILFVLVMRPPASDLGAMALFLGFTAIASTLVGYGAYRFDWLRRSPRLAWTLLGGYALATLLTFLNVGFSARLMFVSQHDLLLAGVLLLFAGGIAMSLGYFLSAAITDKIAALNQGVQTLAEGNLDTRVQVIGQDEVAQLAQAFNDMAGRLQIAERKQRESEQLRRDLIAWVGHDLRTPLTSTRVIIEALADDVVEDAQTRQRYLVRAQRDVETLSALVDDLFDLAKMDAGGIDTQPEIVAISDLISDTVEAFAPMARHQGIRLQGEVSPGVDPVLVDAKQIDRVLANLISNALRHTETGGTILISAHRRGAWVHVSVRDSGEGIPAEDLPHVFERFYRGEKSRSRATGGSGLGLAIARELVAAHGGEIGVESPIDGGTRFWFTIPTGPSP